MNGQVTVVMTAYENLEFLNAAIESVLDQDLGPVELILVDDGSSGDIPGLIEPCGDKVIYIRQDNHGLGVARDAGVKAATSEFIAFCDSDDLQLGHRLSVHAALLEQFPEAASVFSDLLTYKDGEVTAESTLRERQLGVDERTFDRSVAQAFGPPTSCKDLGIEAPEYLADRPVYSGRVPQLIASRHIAWGGASMFRRSKLLEFGGHDPDLRYMEDWQLVSRISKTNDLVFWDAPVLKYRQHAGQLTQQCNDVAARSYRDIVVEVWKDDHNLAGGYRRIHRAMVTRAYLHNIHYELEAQDFGRARADIIGVIRAAPLNRSGYKQLLRCMARESAYWLKRAGNAIWNLASNSGSHPRMALAGLLAIALSIGVISGSFWSSSDPDAVNSTLLATNPSEETPPEGVAADLMRPVILAWDEGRIQEAYDRSQEVSSGLSDLPVEIRENLIPHLVHFSVSLGRLDDAIALTSILQNKDRQTELLAGISFAAGEMSQVRGLLDGGTGFRDATTALLMAMAGLNDVAVELISPAGAPNEGLPRLRVVVAMSALQSGDSLQARSLLRAASNELKISDGGFYFVAMDMLSGIFRDEGDLQNAIDVLENTMPQRGAAARNGSALFWLKCQLNLASLYRQADRDTEANDLENLLRDRLILADDAFLQANSFSELG